MARGREIREAIAGRLKTARDSAGISQAQAAGVIGAQRTAISEIEAGKRKVAAEELKLLADFYEVTVGWLAGDNSVSADPVIDLAARGLTMLNDSALKTMIQLIQSIRDEKKRSVT